MIRPTALFCFVLFFIMSCDNNGEEMQNCPEASNILEQFTQTTGEEIIISANGEAFQVTVGTCESLGTYFSEDFRSANYVENNDGVFISTEEGTLPVKNEWTENFESYGDFQSMFLFEITEVDRIWSTMTLQSVSAPTVSDYVALRNCIFEETCDFIDNRVDLADDPTGIPNRCLKFAAVAPSPDMVTSKSSIQSTLQFFELGDDLWFEARYFIENELPFSIADFENRYFLGSPGPRIVISNNRLAVENKFGAKDIFRHEKDIEVPLEKWFTVKLHFKFDNTDAGLIELWQDDELLISVNGKTLPTLNSIQNSLEIGLTATSNHGGMYMDDIRLSKDPF